MDTKALEAGFKKMGARVLVSEKPGRWNPRNNPSIDIGRDEWGEYFFLRLPGQEAQILNVDKADRHLVLLIRDGGEKSKYLCGHDERHWFVAAIPETAPVTTVASAKEALKPRTLPKDGNWIRQGEWFFIPRPEFNVAKWDALKITKNEPLVRRTRDGRGGKPHMAAEAFQFGGDEVWVHNKYAKTGMTDPEFDAWVKADNGRLKLKSEFRRMRRNAQVFVRGNISHPDHATVRLGHVWHEVLMNRESEAKAMETLVFLD